jgi:hypothetical protein
MRPPAESLRIVWSSYGLKLAIPALKREFQVTDVQNFNSWYALKHVAEI